MSKRRWQDEADGRDARCGASARVLPQDHYTIGWICALPLELAAARAMLDEIHGDLPSPANDDNGYIFGAIGNHCIVMACLPSGVYGVTPAALVARQMQSSFPSIRFYLMVGIGGGVPTVAGADIRLGDVVVSTPTGTCPGVIQYDRGKTVAGGRFVQTGSLKGPPRGLLKLVSKLRAIHLKDGNQISSLLADAAEKLPIGFARPEQEDTLFKAQYDHIGWDDDTCGRCDEHEVSIRTVRETQDPVVHYGIIASGNQVMKHGQTRDSIAQKLRVYCFEMEAAGLADVVECLIIRGICDYCDSHKNKQWQGYAAATAAAYTKELLLSLPAFSEEYKLRSLQTLSFLDMDSRLHNIALPHPDTCDWLFQTGKFQQWQSRNNIEIFNGVLWIKGKPGAGKSTLMKHTLLYCQKNKVPNCLLAAYFFNARGTKLEKSRIGMLRSLLYQLLDQNPEAYNLFLPHFQDKEKKHGHSWQWHEGELETFLRELILALTTPVLILVDALDECDEAEVRKVVSFLERLSSDAVRIAKGSLSICLSSRHYPTISMVKMLELTVERTEEHIKDITVYIQDQLRIKDKNISSELQTKATGVFMWVVLVVKMLNQAWENGDIEAVWTKLREVPSDLDEVFRIILEKDNPHKSRTVLMLQLMLFALEPLTPAELYYGVRSGLEPKSLRRHDRSMVTDQIIERFIVNGSRGLIEFGENGFIQSIHQTVNDFLLRNNRFRILDPELTPNFVGVSHQKIAYCCLAYLSMQDYMGESLENDAISYFNGYYPFRYYAAKYIFHHAEHAQAADVGQEAFLQYLQDNPTVLQQLRTMDRIFSYEGNYWEGPNLLYILSFHHHPKLIQTLLQLRNPSVDINARGGRFGTALQAAVVSTVDTENSTDEVIQVLLSAGVDVNANGSGLYFNALHAAVGYWFSVPQDQGIAHAHLRRIIAVVSMLIGAGADINARGGEFGTVLQAAVAAAAADTWNHYGIPLSEVIQVLLDAGADVNAQGGRYGNALQAAVESAIDKRYGIEGIRQMKNVIQMLLDAGANVNAQGGLYGNALQASIATSVELHNADGDTEYNDIVNMLLKAGADVNAQGGYHGNALQAAVIYKANGSGIKVIKMLLNAGADVNAQGSRYANAVDAAFRTACEWLQHHFSWGPFGSSSAVVSKTAKTLELLHLAGASGAAEAMQNLSGYYHWIARIVPAPEVNPVLECSVRGGWFTRPIMGNIPNYDFYNYIRRYQDSDSAIIYYPYY